MAKKAAKKTAKAKPAKKANAAFMKPMTIGPKLLLVMPAINSRPGFAMRCMSTP